MQKNRCKECGKKNTIQNTPFSVPSVDPTLYPGIFLLIKALESKIDEKYCPRCKTVMSRKMDFGFDKSTSDGLNRLCKDCVMECRYFFTRKY